MKKLYTLLLLCTCFYFLPTAPLAAQALATCAEARLSVLQREALASPRHVGHMNKYDVSFYKLDLQLERNSTYIEGSVTTIARLNGSRLDTFAFELHPAFEILSVVVNGVQQEIIQQEAGDVAVKLASPVLAPATLTAVVTYRGTAPSGASAGNGFSTGTAPTWGNQVAWSLSQPYAAYEWWPTKQVLTDKADSVHVFVTTSAENKVGSNGLLTNTVALPEDKVRYEWKSRYPIAYYLISVAVSDYTEYLLYANPAGATAPVPILNYVYSPEALAYHKNEIDNTAPLLEHFSELFTPYPFAAEKYGHSMAPMGGGMEHQTMTTQSTFFLTLTAHELAHQWFGDHVTCASWEDIWLNEGFASYAEYLALEKLQPEQAYFWLRTTQSTAMQNLYGGGTVRVPDTTNVARIFNFSLSYKKAAAVVHMLRFELNDDALFFQALRNYLQAFGGGTATTADLQRIVEQTAGRDFDYFFNQWYRGEGYPSFAVEWNQAGRSVRVVSTQSNYFNNFFRTDVEYRITTEEGGDTLIRVTHGKPEEDYLFEIGGRVASIEVDPDYWLLRNVSQVSQNSGLTVQEAKPVLVYPNPAYRNIQIENLAFRPTLATVYDATGRLVKQLPISSGQSGNLTVPVEELPAGYYILLVSSPLQRFRSPFIKVRVP